MKLRAGLALFMVLATACRTGRNYAGGGEPRYAGVATTPANLSVPDTLRIVSFNVKYAERVDSALVVLTTEPSLRTADIVL